MIDDNGGTLLRNYVDAEMTNEPPLSMTLNTLRHLALLATVAVAQRRADSHSGIRQLYPLAALGAGKGPVRSPQYLMIRGLSAPVEGDDFRDHLRVAKHGGDLAFEINVRDQKTHPGSEIGRITFNDDATSDTCDHRLHFSHPRWRASEDRTQSTERRQSRD